MTTDQDPQSDSARLARMRRECSAVHPDVVAARCAEIEREQAQRDDAIRGAVLELTAALGYVDGIKMRKGTEVSYETMQRSGFNRKTGWNRDYTLADARKDAATAATRLRNAWELLEPMNPERQAEARRTALGNAQSALQTAIGHLQAVLNKPRTHDEQQAADTLARDWLTRIGSEPD